MAPIVNIGTVSAGYGVIDSVHKKPHSGVDFVIPIGTPLRAPIDGVVSRIADYGTDGLGKAVFVKVSDGSQYVLGHLSEAKVKVGQSVHQGDLLAISGNTGHSTGPHLHFGVFDSSGIAVNPGAIQFSAFTEKATAAAKNAPDWWDLPGQAEAAADRVWTWTSDKIADVGHWLWDSLLSLLDVGLPTLACVGILWWMFSFLPKSDQGIKLTGASLVIYMFYTLLRSAGGAT